MRGRPLLVLALAVAAALTATACTTPRRQPLLGPTTTTAPAPRAVPPGGDPAPQPSPGGGGLPDGMPSSVLIGGDRLLVVDVASGETTELSQPPLENGVTVRAILDRAQGVVVAVRGPLPQDQGAVYVLGDAEHLPRKLGPGAGLVAGARPSEVWITAVPAEATGAVEARRVDLEVDAPPISRTVSGLRTLAGVAAGSLALGPAHDAGPVDLVDPATGSVRRQVTRQGAVLTADGQRAVVQADPDCGGGCRLLLVPPAGEDRTITLPPGLVPEVGGLVTPRFALLVARNRGGPRQLVVVDMTDGDTVVTDTQLPPEAGATPMALDPTGAWAFVRVAPTRLAAVRLDGADVLPLPYELPRFNALAVTMAGTCPCATGGGEGRRI